MKRRLIQTVVRTETLGLSAVIITVTDGLTVHFSDPDKAPRAGQLITVDLSWGDEYQAPVVTLDPQRAPHRMAPSA